jgi:hypothetical protein
VSTATTEIPKQTRKVKRRKKFKAITFTRAGLDPDHMPDPKSVAPDEEYGPFEGPRLSFSWLLGESPTWSGPESVTLYYPEGQALCRFCFHLRRMPAYAYCLGCDRAGRQHLIPPAPLRKRVKARKGERLKGGTG